jgi:hypothetical protein
MRSLKAADSFGVGGQSRDMVTEEHHTQKTFYGQ